MPLLLKGLNFYVRIYIQELAYKLSIVYSNWYFLLYSAIGCTDLVMQKILRQEIITKVITIAIPHGYCK